MSHFAKVQRVGIGSTSLGIVKEVIVAEQDFVDHMIANFPEDNTYWVQTSYNTLGGKHNLGGTPLRKNYAGLGFTYDVTRDAFIPPQNFPSWTLNETTCLWDPPIPKPTDGKFYRWNETLYQSDNTKGWIESAETT